MIFPIILTMMLWTMDNGQMIPHASSKREDDIDNREKILYASSRRDGEDEIEEKYIYQDPKLETPAEFEIQAETDR